MLSKLKISTIDQWSGRTIRPVFLFLAMMLVIAYPGLSHSAYKQLTEYRTDAVQDDFKKSQEAKRSTKDYEEAALSRSEEIIYQKVKTVLEHQKLLESINKELTKKLALKNGIITSLEFNEQILWNQLEANEKKIWDALTAKDKEYQKAKKLTDQLALKDSIIKALKDNENAMNAQLKDNKKKFERALVAIDPGYQPTEERVSLMSNSLFGYSPPATHERSLKSKGYGAYDSNADQYTDAVAANIADGDHPWSSLACTTCHEGNTNYDNEVNISAKITESSKNILWEDNINVSDYMISDSLRSSSEITNDHSKSNNLKEDSISTFRSWTSPPSDTITCNDQESDSFCAEDSKNDSWWNWFYQKISTFKTSVAETVYSYL